MNEKAAYWFLVCNHQINLKCYLLKAISTLASSFYHSPDLQSVLKLCCSRT